jgi:hypothetical protein
VEAHEIVRHRGRHIFHTVDSQMAMSSALRADRASLPEVFLVLISVRGWVNPRTILRQGGLGKLKKIRWPHRESNRNLQSCSTTTIWRAPMNWKESFMGYFEANSKISLEGPAKPMRLLITDTCTQAYYQTEDLQNESQNCHRLDCLVRLNFKNLVANWDL